MGGPDTVLPADSYWTIHRDKPVKLAMGTDKNTSVTPVSVISMFKSTVEKSPTQAAMAVKRGGEWKKWTYKQYNGDVQKAAKSLIKLGLEPFHGVGIVGFNSPEWFITDLAAIHAGGLAVGVYTTNTPEACQYVLENCEANIAVVENDQQLQKILKVWDELPHLKAIVQWEGELKEKNPKIFTWKQFMSLGVDLPDSTLRERIDQQAPNKCCLLIYTSGTTGNPKGVMLSHDNLTWTAQMCSLDAKLQYGQEHLISYLPLSHIAAQMLDIYLPIHKAGTVWFAQPDALKGSLGATLKEVRPTAFFGVPRVWEKIQEKMVATARESSSFKKKVAVWAKDVGLKGNQAKLNGKSSGGISWSVASMMVFKKVKMQLGLDRCNFCLTGAAPIARDTLDFYLSLDLFLCELYGMSENSGPHTVSFPWKVKMGAVGTEVSGVSTKIENPDAEGNGEICMKGRHVFMGYLNQEEKTKEAVDENNWLHTGDVGKKDKAGFLSITGRIKEILITAGGENIAPVQIEDTMKEELPCVSNCMVVGDKKKFLAMLITLKTDVDPDTGMPKDELLRDTREWCQAQGSSATTVSQILKERDAGVIKAIQAGVDRANNRAVSRAAKIQKWSILPRDFSIPGEELGPTLKLKRMVVAKMYAATIESFYADGS